MNTVTRSGLVRLVIGAACPWDCEPVPDGNVGISDFPALLAQWGSAGSCDVDGSGAGVSTIGSSEAVMLAGLALKWRSRTRMKTQNKAGDRPNMIMGSNVQVVWEKFCRYWDVEPRYLPMERGRYVVTSEQVVHACDEEKMGVVGILGNT